MNTYPIDTMRESFLKFMADGASYYEALQLFDEDEFSRAAWEEMESGLTKRLGVEDGILRAGNIVTNDSRELPALFDLLTCAKHDQRNGVHGTDYQQALELWQAGWTSEDPHPGRKGFWGQTQIMSFYWRAPSKRPGKPGRKYLSTNQAFNAMKRGK